MRSVFVFVVFHIIIFGFRPSLLFGLVDVAFARVPSMPSRCLLRFTTIRFVIPRARVTTQKQRIEPINAQCIKQLSVRLSQPI